MEGIDEDVQAVEHAQEQRDIEELGRCVEALQTLSHLFKRVASEEEIVAAEGRRCILAVSGLKYTKQAYYFEVSGASIKVVPPYADYNTLVIAPLESVLRVMKGVAGGNKWAFSEEVARGKTTLKGEHSLHDTYAFTEVFKRLASLAARYGPIEI